MRALDAADPLAHLRRRFVIPDDRLVYFDGNSLGRLPVGTAPAVAAVVADEWGEGLVRSWERWLTLPMEVGDRLAGAALGAGPGQVVVCDSTTVNLFKLASAALDARRGRDVVVTDGADFPTDRYVLQGLARARGLTLRLVAARDATQAIDERVALVTFSVVDYRTAAIADVAGVTAAAHRAGALVLWDLSHAAGAVEVDLDGAGVDLAVGCTYKYLCGGPGAPAWLYVRRGLQEELVPPIWGWFGNEDQFGMGAEFRPAAGIRRWLAGTPGVPALAAVDCGVGLIAEAGMPAIRAKSAALTGCAIELADAWLAPLGFEVASPRDPRQRGGHVALRHPAAERLVRELIEQADVVADFRPPDIVRIGPGPLSTSFQEVWTGFDRIRRVAAQ